MLQLRAVRCMIHIQAIIVFLSCNVTANLLLSRDPVQRSIRTRGWEVSVGTVWLMQDAKADSIATTPSGEALISMRWRLGTLLMLEKQTGLTSCMRQLADPPLSWPSGLLLQSHPEP